MLKLPTIFFFIAGSIFVVIHLVSVGLSLYWQHLWLDIPMHMLGGSVIALSFFAVADAFPRFPKRLLYPVPILLMVLAVGLAWEVFDLKIGGPIEIGVALDTIVDLIMGILGGVVGYVVGHSVSTFDIGTEEDMV